MLALQAITITDHVVHKVGGLLEVGSASPVASPFKGRLPPDVESQLQAVQRRCAENAITDADAAAAGWNGAEAEADRQAAVVAGLAAALSAVLLEAAVKDGGVDPDVIKAHDVIAITFARKLVRARHRAIINEHNMDFLSPPYLLERKEARKRVKWEGLGADAHKFNMWDWPALLQVRPAAVHVCLNQINLASAPVQIVAATAGLSDEPAARASHGPVHTSCAVSSTH